MKKLIESLFILCMIIVSSTVTLNAQPAQEESSRNSASAVSYPCYGYIVPIYPDDVYTTQKKICNLVNDLLHEEITVYWLTSNLTVKISNLLENGIRYKGFNKGSYIIPITNDTQVDFNIISTLYKYKEYYPLEVYELKESIENIFVYELFEPKIALHGGYPDSYESQILWEMYYSDLESGGFRNARILDWDVIADELNNEENDFDVFIIGGAYNDANSTIQQMINQFNPDSVNAIKTFINNGGGYVGSCYGGYQIAIGIEIPWPWGDLFFLDFLQDIFLLFSDRTVFRALPGGGYVKLKIIDSENPVTYGIEEFVTSIYAGGPMFLGGAGNTDTIAVLEEVVNSEFYPFDWDPKVPEIFRNIWYDYAKNKALWVTTNYGDGKVVAFGDHPEMMMEERIIYNAIYYAATDDPKYVSIEKSINYEKADIVAVNPHEGYCEQEIQLNAIPVNWAPSYYSWYFGDDENSNLKNPIHRFYDDKIHKILLFACDDNNTIGYNFSNIEIVPPIVITDINPSDSLKKDESYQFEATVKNGFAPFDYYWDFGDGTYSYEENATHAYDEAGFYYGSLTITDNFEVSDSHDFIISVEDVYDEYQTNLELYAKHDWMEVEFDVESNITFTVCSLIYNDCNGTYYKDPDDYIINISFEDGTYHNSGMIKPKVFQGSCYKYILYEVNHSYSERGIYFPKVNLKNIQKNQTSLYAIRISIGYPPYYNPPIPKKPMISDGFSTCFTDQSYFFNLKTDVIGKGYQSSDYYRINYKIDMGDGTVLEKNGYQNDGVGYPPIPFYNLWFYYKWDTPGTYNIRAQAITLPGVESEWSDPFPVTISALEENQEESAQSQESRSPLS